MMHGDVTVLLLAPLEERELGHPQEVKAFFIDQAELFSQLQTQAAQHVINDGILVRCEKKQVSLFSFHGGRESVQLLFGHELGKRGLVASIRLDGKVGQPLRSAASGVFHQGIDLLSGHTGLSLHIDAAHRAAGLQGRGEHTEAAALHHLGHILQFQTETGIRLVGAEAVHGLDPGHSAQGQLHIQADGLPADVFDQPFIDLHHVFLIHEGQLHVHLRELRLTVRAQVLIPEASGDLEIPVITGTHQQLLENLRRLGKGVKHARMHPAWHQIVSRSLRRGLGEHGRFDLQKAFLRHEFPDRHGDTAS